MSQSNIQAFIEDLQFTVKDLVVKSDDAENRLCCNNVRVLGLPERSEGENPTVFAESFFKDLFQLTDVSPTYVVKRAHMVLSRCPFPGNIACPFLVWFLKHESILSCCMVTCLSFCFLTFQRNSSEKGKHSQIFDTVFMRKTCNTVCYIRVTCECNMEALFVFSTPRRMQRIGCTQCSKIGPCSCLAHTASFYTTPLFF